MNRLASIIQTLVHPDDAGRVLETARQSFASGAPFSTKYRTRRADGVYRWVDARSEPMRDECGAISHWYAISIDIEEEVQAQEVLLQAHAKLTQATRAASLSELAASIAHEVNQPLAAIVADALACQRWLSAEPPNLERAKTTVERLVRDVNSAADVVRRIRALFNQSMKKRTSAKLNAVVAEAGSLMTEEATRRRVRMDIEIEPELPPVAFDRVQIQQVLVNLMRNGMEAMDLARDDRVLGLRVRRQGDMIETEISDRGHGIEFPDKVFEPFFTTKEHGMGMGLAICRSIVESHGGRLWGERNEPYGARFLFTLPVEEDAAS
jgi:C4-dicarboxylate-specific signal transduction histidine kinase